jgi:hypothetical protein
MSRSPERRFCRKVLAVAFLASGLMLMGGVRADDFDRVRGQQEVAAQKLFDEVKTTLSESRRLERTNPTEAARLVRGCLSLVEDDTALTEPQRTAFVRQLRARLRELEDAVRAKRDSDEQAARLAAEKQRREQRLQQERQTEPSGPGARSKDFADSVKGRLAESAKIKSAKEAGFSGVIQSTEAAAVPSDKVMVFASDYAYRAAQRGKQKLTDQEKSLLKALNSVMSVDFNKTSFRDVIDYMTERTGQNINLETESLKEAMVEYDDPVTFKAKKVTVRTILKKVLGDRGLTYIIKDGGIQVVTPQKARETLVARSYPVGDLGSSFDMRFPPLLRRLQMLQNVAQLIDLIQNSIEPSTWQANGGTGTITFYEPSMSLVIRQTAEMHYQLGGALGR